MSASSKFLKLPRGRVRYQEKGSGFPLVMLHGNGGTLESWSLNLSDLAAHFHVHIIDLPGFGESEKNPELSTLEKMGDCIVQILDQFSLSKTNLVGNSMGGVLSLDIAARYGERIERLVLVGTPSGDRQELRKILSLLSGWIKEDNIPRVTEEEASLITPKINPQILKLINTHLEMAGESFGIMNKAIENFNFKESIARVDRPAIIIWGDRDGIVPVSSAWILSRLLHDAPVYLVKGGGHSPQFDNPKHFNKLVIEFLLS